MKMDLCCIHLNGAVISDLRFCLQSDINLITFLRLGNISSPPISRAISSASLSGTTANHSYDNNTALFCRQGTYPQLLTQ